MNRIWLFIIIFFLISIIPTFASTSKYDFSDSINNKAYNDTPNTDFPPLWGSNVWDGVECPDYSLLTDIDANYFYGKSDGNNKEPYTRFNYTINEDETDINWIYVLVTGSISWGGGEDGQCYLADFSTSTWFDLGWDMSINKNHTYNVTSNMGNYIDDGNKQLVVLCIGKNLDPSDGGVAINYAETLVGYTPAISQYCTGSDPYPYTGGDWVITGETICEDEEYINVTGNITIQSGGTLNLINSTVALENLANTSNFTNFDNLYMNDSSNITTNASNIYFWMSIESGADFQSNDSFIERAGYSGKESLKISNPLTCYIDNTTFYPLENQVNIIGDCTLYDSNITSSTYTLNLTNAWGNYSQNYIKALDNDALWLKNVNDSTIDNNEIYASGSGEYAVQLKLLTWLNDTNFTNNYIKSTSDGYSFYASSGKLFNDRFINNDFYGGTETFYHNGYGKDLNFTSNEFWKIGSTTYAVMDLRTNNSHILNNTFYNSTGYTLSLSTTFHNNITNNTFIGTTSNEYAVAIYSGENNTFFDNNITSNGYGLYIGDSNDFVLNNDLKSDDLTLYIYSGSDSNNISWNWLEATGTDKNASFIWSSNNLFKNNSFYSPGGSAIMMFEGNNNSFYEDILTSLSARYDYYANGTGTNYFYDVDFDKSKTGFEDTSKLKVYWSVIANVTDDSGTPIQDANVTAYNVSDIDVWWNLTNATGFTNWTYLEEYNENATNKYFQTNYTFNATKDTYESTQEIINLTYAGTQVNITLTIPFVADTSYTILMPDTYDFPYEYNITAPTEAEANVTDWISFNYSLPFPNYWVQPYAGGNPTRNQNGISQPIFLIDNIGNVNISIYLRYNESLQSGITLSFNASCYPSGYCTFVQTSEKLLTNSYSLVANNISTSSFLNITLWSNYTGSLTGGEYESNILTKANETNP